MNHDNLVLNSEVIEFIKETRSRGIVHSIASYNLEKDILAQFEAFGIADLFIYPKAALPDSGTRKTHMLQIIKDELGISRWEDIVFIDDEISNLQECWNAYPKLGYMYPTAPVPLLDNQDAGLFCKPSYTEEDRLRVRMYEQEAQRKTMSVSYAGDKQEFLKSCEIVVDISYAKFEDLLRVEDLLLRANKMAAISVVYTPELISKYWLNDEFIVVRVKDKFGNYGLSGIVHVEESETGRVVDIYSFVISCRLQGKGIGSAVLASVCNKFSGKPIFAYWDETEYNTAMKELYKYFGFNIVDDKGSVLASLFDNNKELEIPSWLTVVNNL